MESKMLALQTGPKIIWKTFVYYLIEKTIVLTANSFILQVGNHKKQSD